MNAAQKHAQEILPLVTAQANGEVIQQYVDSNGWIDCTDPVAFVHGCKYRIKPRTIIVNGFEVPEPMRERPRDGDTYFCPHASSIDMYGFADWEECAVDLVRLKRGLCHSTKEAAIAHAKAMLGICPKDGE
jgi:hypothetical protein